MSKNDKCILKNGSIEAKSIVDEVMQKIKLIEGEGFGSMRQLFELASDYENVVYNSGLLINREWLDENGCLDSRVKNVILSSISFVLDPLMISVPVVGNPVAEVYLLTDIETN